MPSKSFRDLRPVLIRELVDQIRDGLVLHAITAEGLPGRIEAVNPRACELLGYEEDELLTLRVSDILSPSKLDQAPAIMARIRRDGGAIFESAHICKDGRTIPVEVSTRIFDLSGRPVALSLIRDISARKEADRRLREQEREKSLILESSRDAIMLLGPDLVIRWANGQAAEAIGLPRDELVGKKCFQAWHGTTRPCDDCTVRRAIESKHPQDGVQTKANGSIYEVQAVPVLGEDGNVEAVIDFSRDVTLQRHSERMERMSRFALEHAQTSVFWLDREGTFFYVNDAACISLGYEKDELLGKSVWEIDRFHPADRLPSFWAALRAEGHLHFESEHRRKDGTCFPVEISAHYLHFDGQEYEFAFARDMSVERAASASLRASEARYRELIESLNDVIYALDPKLVIRYLSPRWKELTGLDPHECLGRDWLDFVYPDDRPQLRACLERVLAGELAATEFRLVGADERVVWVRSSSSRTHGRGRSSGLQGMLSNITEQRLLQEEQQKVERERKILAERMDEVSKMEAVGRLAGGMAHDFNNVLGAILGYAELAQSHMTDTEALGDFLQEIVRAGERGAALSKPLLAFSRHQILDPKVFHLGALIQGIAPMLRRLIGEDIRLVVHSAAIDDRISADNHQIEQVLLNLSVNARDAMPRGGTLSMRTRAVDLGPSAAQRLGGLAPGPYVLLEVADTGSGIDPSTQSRVFEPFFTTKSSTEGTGLGLATVWGIVTQSGGAIRLESELGRGTRFFVYLPRSLSKEARKSAIPPAPPSKRTGAATILVAEDEDALRRLVVHVLERAGYQVLAAASPQDAIDKAREHEGPIDLILSDVVMPLMSGPELVERLLLGQPNMAVLYMSGYPDDAILRHGLSRGEIQFLAKPFKAAELRDKILEVLQAKASVS